MELVVSWLMEDLAVACMQSAEMNFYVTIVDFLLSFSQRERFSIVQDGNVESNFYFNKMYEVSLFTFIYFICIALEALLVMHY